MPEMRSAALLALAVLLALAAPARGSGHGHAHKRRTSSLLTWLRRTSGQEELRAKQSQVSMAVETQSACRLQDFLFLGQAFGAVFPLVRGDLHLEQPNDKQHAHSEHNRADNALPSSQVSPIQLHGYALTPR